MQIIVDLANGVTADASLRSQSVTANANGVGVDLANADVRTHLVCNLGAVTNTGNFTIKAQESDDNSTFTDVADTNSTFNVTNASANTLTIKSFVRTKRYVRARMTLNTAGDAFLAGVAILSQKKYEGSNNAGYSISPQS